jgi:AcrR family transcriptional regulator
VSTQAGGPDRVTDRRIALLESARRLFALQGYAGTRTEEIVTGAAVTRSALYYHFRDKVDLFGAVARIVADEWAARLAIPLARLAEQGTRLDLRVGIETYLDAGLDPEFQRIVLVDAPAILGPTAWNALVDERGIGFLRTWLQRAIDERQIDPMPVEPLARLLSAVVAEAGLYIAGSDRPDDARRDTTEAIDRMLLGLGLGLGLGPAHGGRPRPSEALPAGS